MRKLFAIGLSLVMVFGVWAVAMAEVNIKGDFRYEIISDSSKEGQEAVYDNPDLRLEVEGKLNDSLSAYVKLRSEPADSDKKAFYTDEYYGKVKTGFATFKVGDFDYKVNPSRVLAKSNEYNIFTRANGMITGDIPLGKRLYAGFAYAVDGGEGKEDDDVKYYEIKDGAYALSLGFKTANCGAEIHAFDTKADAGVDDADEVVAKSISYDVWLELGKDIKVFSFGNQATYADDSEGDLNPLVGVQFSNLFGKDFKASFEYAVNENDFGYTPYAIQLVYGFSNGLGVELEHKNTDEDDNTKTVGRFRFKF